MLHPVILYGNPLFEVYVGRKRAENAAAGVVIALGLVVGLPLWIMSKVVDGVGGTTTVVTLIILIAGLLVLRSRQRAAKRARLMAKYGDTKIVDLIMQKRFWEGQTQQQLLDSIGGPVAVDEHLLKTKKREVWKYQRTGRNQYKLRLTLENDIVVGWTKRN